MIRYIIEKLIYSLFSLWIMMTLTFFMMKSLPGNPFTEEKTLPIEVVEGLKRHYGLDKPVMQQYWHYIRSIIHWDLGKSLVYPSRSVADIIREGFPVSAILGLQALCLAISFGVLFGTISALCHHHWQDRTLIFVGVLLISIPSFIMATILQYFFGVYLHMLPIARWGSWLHTLLPTLALASFPLAYIARLVRANLLDVMNKDYIKNAYAKGLPSIYIIVQHALPNSLLPVISYLGQFSASILTGSFVIEKIFGIPGLGQWYISSIINRDYPVILGTTVFYSVLLLGLVFLSELVYTVFDPRIELRSYERES